MCCVCPSSELWTKGHFENCLNLQFVSEVRIVLVTMTSHLADCGWHIPPPQGGEREKERERDRRDREWERQRDRERETEREKERSGCKVFFHYVWSILIISSQTTYFTSMFFSLITWKLIKKTWQGDCEAQKTPFIGCPQHGVQPLVGAS